MMTWFCLTAGYGVFVTKNFRKGSFLLEYAGTLLDPKIAELKPEQTYIYYFSLGSKHYWYLTAFYCGSLLR